MTTQGHMTTYRYSQGWVLPHMQLHGGDKATLASKLTELIPDRAC